MDRSMSEFDLIDRLKQIASPALPVLTGIGDDAAVTVHDGPTATSVDAVVEGVHFNLAWSSPLQIAQKAVGTALSDIAAMADLCQHATLDDIGAVAYAADIAQMAHETLTTRIFRS